MNRRWIAGSACVAALAVAALGIPHTVSSAAQKAAASAPNSQSKARSPRLPNYYARVTTDEQRVELREVLNEFAPRIQEKRKELQALIAKRNAALDKLLTPEQRQQIAKLRADAAARRKAGGSAADGKAKKKSRGKKAA